MARPHRPDGSDRQFGDGAEFQRMAPDGVTTHANRVELKDVTPASLLEMEGDVARSARQIAQTRVGVIAFGCTSGSFVGGPGYDDRLIGIIEGETGVAATTTTTAVIWALQALRVSRIALATPYTDEVTQLEVNYLQANGFEVTNWQGGGIVGGGGHSGMPAGGLLPPRPRRRQRPGRGGFHLLHRLPHDREHSQAGGRSRQARDHVEPGDLCRLPAHPGCGRCPVGVRVTLRPAPRPGHDLAAGGRQRHRCRIERPRQAGRFVRTRTARHAHAPPSAGFWCFHVSRVDGRRIDRDVNRYSTACAFRNIRSLVPTASGQ